VKIGKKVAYSIFLYSSIGMIITIIYIIIECVTTAKSKYYFVAGINIVNV